jgi:hypothetical protein
MRICLVSILALLMPANFPAGSDQRSEVGGVGGHPQIKLERNKGAAQKGKARQFHLDYEIEFQQLTGNDTDIDGTRLPGRTLQRLHSTFDVPDGHTIVYKGNPIDYGNDQDGDSFLSYRISLDTVDNAKVRLQVSTQDKRTYTFKDGSMRSWNLRLQATKTVKLREKFKLDLTDENIVGIKATIQGVVEENVQK